MFGISVNNYNAIIKALASFPSVDKAFLFGSRALGNYKTGSDIDIAVCGKSLTIDASNKLSNVLNEELPIPYKIDIINYNSITSSDLKIHIDEQGICIYSREG